MAGDWIKMRGNLWDDPRVGRICDLTEATEGPVIGALYWLWTTADQHTEDGFLPGMTLRQIDRKTGLAGFGAALRDVGWITEDEDGVTIIKFEEHNGASAKRRCTDAQRKANSRKDSTTDPHGDGEMSARDADNARADGGQKAPNLGAREEKRREEEQTTAAGAAAYEPEGFKTFWDEWPRSNRKGGKVACLKFWRDKRLELQAHEILMHLKTMKVCRDWTKDSGDFIPAPVVYLRARRWDGAEVAETPASRFAGAI